MPYNSYMPAGYGYGNYLAYQTQTSAQPQPMQQQGQSIIWVNNETEAAMYPVAPNSAVVLWDSNNPTVYKKVADASGKPSITIYDLVERKPVMSSQAGDFATRDDLLKVAAAVDALQAEFDKMKKPVRKKEETPNE